MSSSSTAAAADSTTGSTTTNNPSNEGGGEAGGGADSSRDAMIIAQKEAIEKDIAQSTPLVGERYRTDWGNEANVNHRCLIKSMLE